VSLFFLLLPCLLVAVFMISEEDKSSEVAKEYWFRVFDLDGDGRLSRDELEFFFTEQQQRMQHLAHESILFDDIFCQLYAGWR
jgi:serine/threonine-protein phosphatase 2A regulatory subunit B''